MDWLKGLFLQMDAKNNNYREKEEETATWPRGEQVLPAVHVPPFFFRHCFSESALRTGLSPDSRW